MARRHRVLIVEDEREVNELLAFRLRKEGYEVDQAWDGAGGLALAEQRRPDLVLLDIGLPTLDGWRLLEALESGPGGAATPAVIYTVRGSREDFDRGTRFPNVRGYFRKPYATEDVLRHVTLVLGGPETEDETP